MEIETKLRDLLKDKRVESMEFGILKGRWRIVWLNKNYNKSYLYDTKREVIIQEIMV